MDDVKSRDALQHMETILIKELPRVADVVGGMMRDLESQLALARGEIAELHMRHADDLARLAELETLRRQNAEFAAKLEAIEELKRAVSKL